MLFAAQGMLRFGIAGSLMSLGAIDFGLIVDSSVIMVENAARRISEDARGRSVREIVRGFVEEVLPEGWIDRLIPEVDPSSGATIAARWRWTQALGLRLVMLADGSPSAAKVTARSTKRRPEGSG